jgi:hypothetical protein
VKDSRGDIFGAEKKVKTKAKPETLKLNPWTSDSQNVHDRTVKTLVKNKIKTLKNKETTSNSQTIFEQISGSYSDDSFLQKVDTLLQNKSPHSDYKMSEHELITNVWGRINSPDNSHNKQNLKEMFKTQIEDCFDETGKPHCYTGRMSRIL